MNKEVTMIIRVKDQIEKIDNLTIPYLDQFGFPKIGSKLKVGDYIHYKSNKIVGIGEEGIVTSIRCLQNNKIDIYITKNGKFNKLHSKIPIIINNSLYHSFIKFFSYIINDNINNYNIDKLYDIYQLYISSADVEYVERLTDIHEWLKVYNTEDKITNIFNKINVSVEYNGNIEEYLNSLIKIMMDRNIVELTLLESYFNLHSTLDHIYEICMIR
jgi:hypothetical protein